MFIKENWPIPVIHYFAFYISNMAFTDSKKESHRPTNLRRLIIDNGYLELVKWYIVMLEWNSGIEYWN